MTREERIIQLRKDIEKDRTLISNFENGFFGLNDNLKSREDQVEERISKLKEIEQARLRLKINTELLIDLS